MWLAILILAPIGIVVHGHYFSYRIRESVTELAPKLRRPAVYFRRGFLLLTYTMPTLIAAWVIYIVVASPESASPPESWILDYFIVVPFWGITVYAVQCTVFLLPIDALYWLFTKMKNAPWWARRVRNTVAVAIAAVFAIFVPTTIVLGADTIEERQFSVVSQHLPKSLEGFRIALISDPQADQFTTGPRIAELVRAVNTHKPDLVLIAGDIITRTPPHAKIAARELGKLKAKHGVVSCIGDHDNFAFRDRKRSVALIKDALHKQGVAMLHNQVHYPLGKDKSLAVTVLTDNYITPAYEVTLEKLLATINKKAFRIVLAHQVGSGVLEVARNASVDLFLSGHTHGGQVNFWLPFFQPVMARIETPYITGRYAIGDTTLIVSSGLGVSVFPFRYRAPATYEIITLQKASK